MPRNKFRSRFWFSLSSRALRYFYNWMQNSNEFRRVVSFILGSFHVFHFWRGDRERRPKKKQQRKAFRQQAIFFLGISNIFAICCEKRKVSKPLFCRRNFTENSRELFKEFSFVLPANKQARNTQHKSGPKCFSRDDCRIHIHSLCYHTERDLFLAATKSRH